MTQTAPRRIDSVLVATDLSERSERALRRAFRLAREQGATLTVAHIFDDSLPPDMVESHEAAARRQLDRLCADLGDGIDVTIVVRKGDVTADILELEREISPDLLVLGLHRPRPLLDLFRETTMERLVRLSAIPVLLVRDADDRDYRTVISASDFSPAAASAVRLANRLAPEARIIPVHALHVPYSGMLGATPEALAGLELPFRKEADELAREWSADPTLPQDRLQPVIVRVGPVIGALHHALDEHDGQLVCVGAHGRAGQAPSILGSVANDLMRNPPSDVLVARPRRS